MTRLNSPSPDNSPAKTIRDIDQQPPIEKPSLNNRVKPNNRKKITPPEPQNTLVESEEEIFGETKSTETLPEPIQYQSSSDQKRLEKRDKESTWFPWVIAISILMVGLIIHIKSKKRIQAGEKKTPIKPDIRTRIYTPADDRKDEKDKEQIDIISGEIRSF